jgi:hypothetical protein
MATDKEPIKDTDIIWFGKHKGTAFANVPDSYFLYLWNNGRGDMDARLKAYIESNLESIMQNCSNFEKHQRNNKPFGG